MSVSIVVQRFRECRLLIDESEYVTVGGDNNTSSCGILAYASFASSTTRAQVMQAAQTLLNLPILTTGLWGDGESSTRSLLALAVEAELSCSLVIVPQANLISKVKQNGKSIQYHGQINKEEGQQLYNYFNECLQGILLEEQCLSNNEELPEWYKKRRAYHLEQQNNKHDDKQSTPSSSTPPNQIFIDKTKYSEWDEDGFPLKDTEGNVISKSQMKKLKKVYDAHCKRYDKWKADGNNNVDDAVEVGRQQNSNEDTPPPQCCWSDLNPTFCHFVAGSFGKRQGLELRSDMGPFVHSFQV